MNTTKKLTARQQIQNVFVTKENRFLTTLEILSSCVDVAKQTVYGTISAMATAVPAQLQRRALEGGAYEYALPEEIYQQLKNPQTPQAADIAPEPLPQPQPDVPQPASQEQKEEPKQPEAIQLPSSEEYKRSRQKPWNQEDQAAFCVEYLRIRDSNLGANFEFAANEAQKRVISEDKRKTDLKSRKQLPWFEDQIQIARETIKREDADRAERERLEREAQQKQEQQFSMLNVLQSVGNDVLMGEILRRGQSLVESMLINALQSPNVQKAFMQTIFKGQLPDRRTHERPNYEAPEQQRERLERIGILGVNRPVHQNQMKHRIGNLFDLRFGNVDGSASQLQATMAGCDEVFVLTDSVPHRTTAQLKAANIKFTPISGDKRAMEDYLSRRYMEKNNGK